MAVRQIWSLTYGWALERDDSPRPQQRWGGSLGRWAERAPTPSTDRSSPLGSQCPGTQLGPEAAIAGGARPCHLRGLVERVGREPLVSGLLAWPRESVSVDIRRPDGGGGRSEAYV